MFAILKSAAAIVTAAAGVWYFAAVSPSPASATTEFVEAAQKLQEARTLSFRQTITTAGIPVPMAGRSSTRSRGWCASSTTWPPQGSMSWT